MKNINLLIKVTACLYIALLVYSCKWDLDHQDIVVTGSVNILNENTVNISGEIVDTKNQTPDIESYGFCWSNQDRVALDEENVETIDLGTANQRLSFNAELEELRPDVSYFCRSYAIVDGKVIYGKIVTFNTLGKPLSLVNNLAVIRITSNSAAAMAELTENGNIIRQNISSIGHIISTDAEAPLESWVITEGDYTTEQTFISSFSNLLPDTVYYVRAFVQRTNGEISYSNLMQFKTIED